MKKRDKKFNFLLFKIHPKDQHRYLFWELVNTVKSQDIP